MTSFFPLDHQLETNWCWAAVGVSVNSYFSPQPGLEQCRLASDILHFDCCETPPPAKSDQEHPLEDVLKHLGVLDRKLENRTLTFEQIRSQIKSGLPMCARVGWFGEDRGHFVVIWGYSVSASGEQWLDIADPFFGRSTIPYDQFKYSYLDSGEWTDTYLVKKP